MASAHAVCGYVRMTEALAVRGANECVAFIRGHRKDAIVADIGTGSGAITKDGCPVEVYAALSPRLEVVEMLQRLLEPGGSILDLGAGTGLVAEPLAMRGFRVVAVDDSPEMLSHLRRAVPVQAQIQALRLEERFDVVLLASHLVNTPDGAERQRLLSSAARHVKPSGRVVIEWHPPEWFAGLAPGERSHGSMDGFLVELFVHDLNAGLLTATVVYRRGDEKWTQDFQARRLTRPDLASEVRRVGLDMADYLTDDHRWVSARWHASFKQGSSDV